METKRIAILDDYLDSAVDLVDWSLLDVALKPKGAVSDIQVFHHPTVAMSETEIAEMLLPFQVLLVMRERTPLPASLIEKLKNYTRNTCMFYYFRLFLARGADSESRNNANNTAIDVSIY